MLRSVVVALLLLRALKCSLSMGLWTLGGFLIARLVCGGFVALSMMRKQTPLSKQEMSG